MTTSIGDTRHALRSFLGLEKKMKIKKTEKLQKRETPQFSLSLLLFLKQKKGGSGRGRGVYEKIPKNIFFSSPCAFYSRLKWDCFFPKYMYFYLFYFAQLLLSSFKISCKPEYIFFCFVKPSVILPHAMQIQKNIGF